MVIKKIISMLREIFEWSKGEKNFAIKKKKRMKGKGKWEEWKRIKKKEKKKKKTEWRVSMGEKNLWLYVKRKENQSTKFFHFFSFMN